MHMRAGNWLSLVAVALLALGGCGKKKGGVTVEEAPSHEAEPTEKRLTPEQIREREMKKLEARRNPGAAADAALNKKKDPDAPPWGVQVAELATRLTLKASDCNEKIFKKLKPDNLKDRKSPYEGGGLVLSKLTKTCDLLDEELGMAVGLLEGRHATGDAFLEHYTLLVDFYRRIRSICVTNARANEERLLINFADLQSFLPQLTKTTVPALKTQGRLLMKFTGDHLPKSKRVKSQKLDQAGALAYFKGEVEETTAELKKLEAIWLKYAHAPLAANVVPRRQYLGFKERALKRRLAKGKLASGLVSSGSSDYDKKLRAAMTAYYAAVDVYLAAGWQNGMKAVEAFTKKNTQDADLIKNGKKGWKKANKTFDKAVAKLKWPG